jgi:hypothetical protein
MTQIPPNVTAISIVNPINRQRLTNKVQKLGKLQKFGKANVSYTGRR